MENKIFRKNISVDCVFYGFDPEIGLHFYFHYKPFPSLRRAKRERERERERVTDPPKIDRTLAPAPPSRSHHHRDRTPPRLHHHWRLIRPKPISLALLLPMANLITLSISSLPMIDLVSILTLPMTDLVSISSPMTDLVAHDPWPISPFPSIFDHSLFLPLLVWPNCGV